MEETIRVIVVIVPSVWCVCVSVEASHFDLKSALWSSRSQTNCKGNAVQASKSELPRGTSSLRTPLEEVDGGSTLRMPRNPRKFTFDVPEAAVRKMDNRKESEFGQPVVETPGTAENCPRNAPIPTTKSKEMQLSDANGFPGEVDTLTQEVTSSAERLKSTETEDQAKEDTMPTAGVSEPFLSEMSPLGTGLRSSPVSGGTQRASGLSKLSRNEKRLLRKSLRLRAMKEMFLENHFVSTSNDNRSDANSQGRINADDLQDENLLPENIDWCALSPRKTETPTPRGIDDHMCGAEGVSDTCGDSDLDKVLAASLNDPARAHPF